MERRLTEQVLEYAKRLPEGTPVAAKSLLHLGNREAVDQALSRLARRGGLIRAGRGIYVHPVQSRFGTRAPAVEQVIEAFARQRGEVIVASGAAAANALGLTTQVPIQPIYLTSGRNRLVQLGKQLIKLKHAPSWQLILPGSPAGQVLRALAWAGPEKAEASLRKLKPKLSSGTLGELITVTPQLPTWLARIVSKVTHE